MKKENSIARKDYREYFKPYLGETKKYKEWCEIVGEKVQQGGRTRELHMKRWRQFVRLDNEGKGNLKLVYLYSDNELKLTEREGKFYVYIRNYILSFVKGYTGTPLRMSASEILRGAYMVNSQYFNGMNHPEKYVDKFDLYLNRQDEPEEDYIKNMIVANENIFFSATNRLLRRLVSDSIKRMENEHLILADKTFRAYTKTKTYDGNTVYIKHDVTQDERERILAVILKTIEKYNDKADLWYLDKADSENHQAKNRKREIKSESDLFCLSKKEIKKYFDMRDKIFQEEFHKEGYTTFFPTWSISLPKSNIIDFNVYQLDYRNLNKNVYNKLKESKDLESINTFLKEQFIDNFIKI